MISSYAEALQYLYDNLPMFQNVGAAAFRKDLTNTLRLCEKLGNPHKRLRTVHVAGTNGKGSTCHMVASILQEAGYRTGLYTSPHLKSFTERIRINGQEVSPDYVVDFVNRMRNAIEEIRPSFFEITVAMAFDAFAAANVDIAVIEVGMGGRLDSTNVIVPVVSVITNISRDHQEFLGDTLEKIAAEKAGIIKPGVPVVVGEEQAEVAEVFRQTARTMNAPLSFAAGVYTASFGAEGTLDVYKQSGLHFGGIPFPLRGGYQRRNVPTVMMVCDILSSVLTIAPEHVVRGLERVVLNTGLKGRWQVLSESPKVVCDTGHNADGIREIVREIRQHSFQKLFMVIGVVKDKDLTEILTLLPKEATYYFCQAALPRALEAAVLAHAASAAGLCGQAIPDVNAALRAAMRAASPDDFIFVGGSTFVVAEIEQL